MRDRWRDENVRSRRRTSLTTLALLCLGACTTSLVAADPFAAAPSETFTETLLLKPLPDGRVSASFDFVIASTSSSLSQFRLLPRPLLQPIQRFGASEVHLSLNTGRWKYDDWGSPRTKLRRRSKYGGEDEGSQTAPGRDRSEWMTSGEESVGSGAEVWARFEMPSLTTAQTGEDDEVEEEQQQQELYANWRGLTSSLAGLFCASLDALDERSTVLPTLAYADPLTGSSRTTVHALLPSEGVCTENLTPLLKLLPCKGAAGLSTLLNPLTLFGANFQGLGVHVIKKPPQQFTGEEGGWEVRFTFTAVFAPAVTRDVSIRDWSLSTLFGRKIDSTCPIADQSLVRVLSPLSTPINNATASATSQYALHPLPPIPSSLLPSVAKRQGLKLPILQESDEIEDELARAALLHFPTPQEEEAYSARLQTRWSHYLKHEDGEYLYNLASIFGDYNTSKQLLTAGRHGAEGLDIAMSWPNETRFSYPDALYEDAGSRSSAIRAERTLVGHGQERTTLQVTLTNPDSRAAQNVIWFESLGFFVKPFLHTLKHDVQVLPTPEIDQQPDDEVVIRSARDLESPIEHFSYQPSKSSSRKPYVLETVVRIPASSRVVLQLELRKEFVRYSQHPPDAHRGFDLSPGIIFPLAPIDPRTALLQQQRRQQHPSGSSLSRNVPTEPHYRLSTDQSRIYTLPKLVELATPDFSFVYTNIIFTSTVIALFFGSTLNTLLRTFRDFVV